MPPLVQEIQLAIHSAIEDLLRQDTYRSYVGDATAKLAESLSELHGGAGVELFSSGTAALETVLRGANVGVGQEVVLAGYDYPGNFWAIERVGARPVLIDTLADSWQVDLNQLEAAGTAGNSIRAVVVSHLHGQLQPMRDLRKICQRQGWLLIEDNCQALGSLDAEGDQCQLSGLLGDASIVSFGGGKVFSAGRGGGCITQDPQLLQRVRVAAGAGSGPYALSELQAAVILAQLPYLERLRTTTSRFFVELASRLTEVGSERLRPARIGSGQLAYQFGLLLASERENREQLVHRLREQQLYVGRGFDGFHRRGLRRCRAVAVLRCTPGVAARTLVVHHRQALDGELSPLQVAERLMQSLPSQVDD